MWLGIYGNWYTTANSLDIVAVLVSFVFRHRQKTPAQQCTLHLVAPMASSEVSTGSQWSSAPQLAHVLKASAVKDGGGTSGVTVLTPA